MHRLEFLSEAHLKLKPRRYAEIGVFRGKSMAIVAPMTRAIGIDPSPVVSEPVPRRCRIFAMTSDSYFQERNLKDDLHGPVDLAYIDGLHHYEAVLRDFRNVEAASHADTVVLLDDCLPRSEDMASREQQTELWTGDVWKALLAIHRYRKDLRLTLIDTEPTGTGMITGIDPGSRVLHNQYDELVEKMRNVPYDTLRFTEELPPVRPQDALELLTRRRGGLPRWVLQASRGVRHRFHRQ